MATEVHVVTYLQSQCTYRCVVLPDVYYIDIEHPLTFESQCTYRCVVLPDRISEEFWVQKG